MKKMTKVVKIRKGLDIKLKGKPEKTISKNLNIELFALKPPDFEGITPKLKVKIDSEVKAGTALFFNKYQADAMFTSPVSGKVVAINRGERRKLLEIVIKADESIQYEEFKQADPKQLSKEQIIENLLKSGTWPFIRQRPYSIIANPNVEPKAIYISAFDSAPLAPDYDFMLKDEQANLQMGIDALTKLTQGKVYLNLKANDSNSVFAKMKNVEKNYFSGPHPAGNVGIQIHHLNPINKGEVVWYLNPQDIVIIGRLFATGKFDARKTVALVGSEVKKPQYYETILGASIEKIVADNVTTNDNRYISGNVLTGTQIIKKGFISFFDSMISVIPEGKKAEFLGWGTPGFGKYSVSRTFFSWLTPNKEFALNTNMKGGLRSFVVTGEYDKVFPMDILPQHLLKAIIIEDIDQMEELGIYEVAEEDFALCEFVCTSKINVQEIVRNGLNLMYKEMN